MHQNFCRFLMVSGANSLFSEKGDPVIPLHEVFYFYLLISFLHEVF